MKRIIIVLLVRLRPIVNEAKFSSISLCISLLYTYWPKIILRHYFYWNFQMRRPDCRFFVIQGSSGPIISVKVIKIVV